jgi:hypothetical protein
LQAECFSLAICERDCGRKQSFQPDAAALPLARASAPPR